MAEAGGLLVTRGGSRPVAGVTSGDGEWQRWAASETRLHMPRAAWARWLGIPALVLLTWGQVQSDLPMDAQSYLHLELNRNIVPDEGTPVRLRIEVLP